MSNKRVHVYFTGTVQGVGFRFTTQDIALQMGNISGWVSNLPDRSVELVAEGEEKDLLEFLRRIEEYFPSYIKNKRIEWEKATGEFNNFEIQ